MPPCHSTTASVDLATLDAHTEESGVRFYDRLTQRMFAIGAQRLLMAGLDWEKLFSSANPPGAPAPKVAQATYTRVARQQQKQRQMARRSGSAGLRKAIRAAA